MKQYNLLWELKLACDHTINIWNIIKKRKFLLTKFSKTKYDCPHIPLASISKVIIRCAPSLRSTAIITSFESNLNICHSNLNDFIDLKWKKNLRQYQTINYVNLEKWKSDVLQTVHLKCMPGKCSVDNVMKHCPSVYWTIYSQLTRRKMSLFHCIS